MQNGQANRPALNSPDTGRVPAKRHRPAADLLSTRDRWHVPVFERAQLGRGGIEPEDSGDVRAGTDALRSEGEADGPARPSATRAEAVRVDEIVRQQDCRVRCVVVARAVPVGAVAVAGDDVGRQALEGILADARLRPRPRRPQDRIRKPDRALITSQGDGEPTFLDCDAGRLERLPSLAPQLRRVTRLVGHARATRRCGYGDPGERSALEWKKDLAGHRCGGVDPKRRNGHTPVADYVHAQGEIARRGRPKTEASSVVRERGRVPCPGRLRQDDNGAGHRRWAALGADRTRHFLGADGGRPERQEEEGAGAHRFDGDRGQAVASKKA